MIDTTATVRGVTIGAGTSYRWTRWPDGLLGTADIRAVDLPFPRRDGVIPADDFVGSRRVAFEVVVLGSSRADAEAKIVSLAAAFAASADDEWLDVRIAGNPSEYSLRGRCRGADVAMSSRFVGGVAEARCVFVATDPVRYAQSESSLLLTLAAAGAGLTFPASFPVVFGGGGGAGSGVAVNAGTAEVDWTATFTGPLTNPRLALDGSGRSIRILATLAAGETVVGDSATSSILFGGTSPRPSWFAPGSRWFRLAPGANGLTFTADSGNGTVSITWRSGWS